MPRQRGTARGGHRRAARLAVALSLTALCATLPAHWAVGAEHEPAASHPAPAATADVPLDELTVTTTEVASGLERPTAIAPLDDGSGQLLITEKPGTIRVYHPDTGLAEEPLADLTDQVDESGNERGLLGLAPAPDVADSQVVYLAYTRLPDSAVTLARYHLTDGTLEELITQEHAEYTNHNGGQLAFGSDGYLYWAIGDGGGSGDPYQSGQRLDTLLGKILRVDVSRSCDDLGYCVPEDNPFVDDPDARGEIWAYGLRNPWRFAFDPEDGSLWIGDVGQGAYEEVDHVPGDEGGHNFGWSCREGPAEFDPEHCVEGAELTEPVFTYPSTEGCSVIGGRVYRGAEYADLAGGTYVATDYCDMTAWAVRPEADGTYTTGTIGEFPTQVTTFGTDTEGELYVANDLPGQLFKVGFATR